MPRPKLPRDADGNIIRNGSATPKPVKSSVPKAPKEISNEVPGASFYTPVAHGFNREYVPMASGKFVDHSWKFKNLPEAAVVSASTAEGVRVVLAMDQTPGKYYLRKFVYAGDDGFLRNGVKVFDSINERVRYLDADAVAVYPGKQSHLVKENRPHVNVTGHRDGTKAADRAERKLARQEIKRKKFEAKEKIRLEKEAKKKAKLDKKNAKLLKKKMLAEKKAARLLKKEKKLKKAEATKKTASKFFDVSDKPVNKKKK